jgi:sulfate/thiosulfate transport system substrate-binding protein
VPLGKFTTVPLMRLAAVFIALLILAPIEFAHAAHPHDSVKLSLVAYSTPQEAYGLLIPAFQKTKAGAGVTFQTSFGASGDQSIAVSNGLPADIVAFSLEPDIGRLVGKGLVNANWYKGKYHGFVTDSVVVFAVRKGNPKHIHTWNDLLKSGVEVITPNPFTSGGARWNVMAAYGAQLAQHESAKQAEAYLGRLFSHVSVQDTSARAELQTFVGGKGDVMLAYENEAITAQDKGQSLDYVIPPQTILIENPVAVTKTTTHAKQANAFVNFLYTTRGQELFAGKGYRPVVASVLKGYRFKKPKTLFTIRSFNLGGWSKVQNQFFNPTNGIMAQIERAKGISP